MWEYPYPREQLQRGKVTVYLENEKLYFQHKLQKILLAGELTVNRYNRFDSWSTFLGSGTVLNAFQRLFYPVLTLPQ